MLKKEWASAIIDYLTTNYPDELEHNEIKKIYSSIYDANINMVNLKVSGKQHLIRKTDLIFLISCLGQDYLNSDTLLNETLRWITLHCYFPTSLIAWKNIREAFENNQLILKQNFVGQSGAYTASIYFESPSDKVNILLDFNSSLTMSDFFNKNFKPIVSGNMQVDYIINKDYKTTDKIDLLSIHKNLSENPELRGLKVKIKFYPLENEVGYDMAPFGLDLSREDLIAKYLDTIE